jgi:hypothetical protein
MLSTLDVETKRRGRAHLLLGAVLLATALALLAAAPGHAGDEAAAAGQAPQWDISGKKLLSTNSPYGADTPSIAYRPDGGEIMAIYNHWYGSVENRDPYYTIYNGVSWSTPAVVAASPNTKSGSARVAYDGAGNAHAIWTEPDGIYYARFGYTSRTWSGLRRLSVAQTGTDLFMEPDIATNGNEVDAVWAQGVGNQNPDIFYASSANNGNSWSAPAPVNPTSQPLSHVPGILITPGGQRHLVWQENTLPHSQLLYTSKTSATGSWRTPFVLISSGIGANSEPEQPRLAVQNGKVHVSFTVSRDVSGYRQKWIYYTSCSSNCAVASSYWSPPMNVSIQPVQVNEFDPFWAISDLFLNDSCAYVFFYGYDSSPANEVVWNVNSCDSWNNGGRDQVTSSATRSLYPDVAIYERQIVLAYEQVSGDRHDIYVHFAELPPPKVFLPKVVLQ